MEGIVQKCLAVCDNKRTSTIAFPALGAGILKYPARVVAKVMINTVQNYYQTNTKTCIKEVKLVMYTDDSYKEFEHVLSQYSKPAVTPTVMDSSIPAFASNDLEKLSPFATANSAVDSSLLNDRSSTGVSKSNSVTTSSIKAPIKICGGKLLNEKVRYSQLISKLQVINI